MRIWLFLLVLLYWLCLPAQAGTVYYVSKAGSNSGGTSWANAFTHPDSADAHMVAGDTVAIGKGTWYNVRFDPPSGATPNSQTVYACSTWYLDPTDAAVRDAGRKLCTLWAGSPVTGWDLYSGSIYEADFSGTSNGFSAWGWATDKSWCIVDATAGTGTDTQFLSKRTSPGSASDVTGPGQYWQSTSANKIYLRAYDNSDPDTKTIIVCDHPVFYFAEGVDCIRVWGLDLRGGKWGTVFIDVNSTDSIHIEHCHLAFSGADKSANASNWFSTHTAFGTNSHWNLVRSCSLGWAMDEYIGGGGSAPSSGWSHGGNMTTYSVENMVVESCYAYGFAMAGFHYKNDWANAKSDTPFVNNKVRFSTVTNVAQFGIGYMAQPKQCSAYGNILFDITSSYGAIRFDDKHHPPGRDSEGRTFVGNNTFYNVREAHSNADDYGNCGDSDYNEIKFSICEEISSIGYWVGLQYSNTNCHNSYEIDSNIYYDAGGRYSWRTYSSTYSSLAAWQGAGFDANSSTASGALLVDPASHIFTPTDNVPTMNLEYGGRTWTVYGAIQPDSGSPTITSRDPANDSTVGTTANLRVSLSDPDMNLLTIYVIGGTVASPTDTIFTDPLAENDTSYTYPWTGLSDAERWWKMIVKDEDDNEDTTEIRNFCVTTPCTLHVTSAPDSLTFVWDRGDPYPDSQAITLANQGNGTPTWTTTISDTWIDLTDSTDAVPTGTYVKFIDTTGQGADTLAGTIIFDVGGVDDTTKVVLRVTDTMPPHAPVVTLDSPPADTTTRDDSIMLQYDVYDWNNDICTSFVYGGTDYPPTTKLDSTVVDSAQNDITYWWKGLDTARNYWRVIVIDTTGLSDTSEIRNVDLTATEAHKIKGVRKIKGVGTIR